MNVGFSSEFISNLINFEYDGENFLYDMEPVQSNMFWAGDFSNVIHNTVLEADAVKSKTAAAVGEPSGSDIVRPLSSAPFRIKKISFPMPSLDFKEGPTRHNLIDAVKTSRQVVINWYDDAYRSVQKYHFDWSSYWYDKMSDSLPVGAAGKFRHLNVVLYHYVNANSSSKSVVQVPVPEPILLIRLRYLVPKEFGALELDMSSGGNGTLLQITYAVELVQLCYNKLYKEAGNIWNPSGLTAATNNTGADLQRSLWDQEESDGTNTPWGYI